MALFRTLSACLLVSVLAGAAVAEERTGEQIYKATCASCHGANGEGTLESYPHRLAGDRTVEELAKLIEKTMPEDDPGSCTGPDARKVAEYVYTSFYSRTAQAKFAPLRIELSRLTVRQYQNAVTDLIGSFRFQGTWDAERGLRGDYYKGRRLRGRDAELSRRDGTVQFHFGEASPQPSKIEAKEFSVRWEGSVFAPETGEYEFIVRSENGVRLWLNDVSSPVAFIDAGVKSGDDTEFKQSIRLLGGRAYPVRLELVKANEKTASIALLWKLPHRPVELIPERCLTPNRFPETFVLTTPFPPDDRTVGYERGTSISREWERATTDAAIEVATYVGTHLRELTGQQGGGRRRREGNSQNTADSVDPTEKLKEFARRFVERAFRRPLTDEQRQLYVERQFVEAGDPELAVKRVVLLALKSPRFLYRELSPAPTGETATNPVDAYDVASRLSFGLWDSLPDERLLEAAARGQLGTREQIIPHVERMLGDLRTRSKVREFLLQWLKVEHVIDVAKDPAKYPEFNETIASDLRTSLDLFLDDVVWSPDSDFRRLLMGNELWLNGRLAKFYGGDLLDLPEETAFLKLTLDTEERAGVLSHPYLMAGFAYTASSSPIHRGVFIARSVLGRSLRPPPEAVAPLAPDLAPDLTTRERVTVQTRPESCQACHAMINPLGFPLEQFDAVGRFRTEERGKPVDPTGAYRTRTGDVEKFAGLRELATFLANSDETHAAFVEQTFHYLVKQPIRAYGPDTLPQLKEAFTANGYSIRRLLVEVMARSALQ